MLSKFGVVCKVLETGSFSKTAEYIGYSQSAVSQTIKSLEAEMGITIFHRKSTGIALTVDGEQLLPYIKSIDASEKALEEKLREMKGLNRSVIRLGTFTSVSRNLLPGIIKDFRRQHPSVRFVLRQGEYTNIREWLLEGSIDLGFICTEAICDLDCCVLYEDELMAVLPPSHPLRKQDSVSLAQLEKDPFILLDEGKHSMTLAAFERCGLHPNIAYTVYDDYSILSMIREGLGVSALYRRVLQGYGGDWLVRPVKESPKRTIALAWRDHDTLPVAARRFAEAVRDHCQARRLKG